MNKEAEESIMNTENDIKIDQNLLDKIKQDKINKTTESYDKPMVQVKAEATAIAAMASDPQAVKSKDIDLETQMISLWNIPQAAMQESKQYASQIKMTHGMLAAVPILCKADQCPYVTVCTMSPQNRTVGQRCPMEAAAMVTRFRQYCDHFDLNMSNPTSSEVVDMSLVNDLVEVEIQMLRAANRIAINGDFITTTIGSVDQKGNVYYEDALDPAVEYNDKMKDKRYKIYRLLDSTRKDKSSKAASENNPSIKAAGLFSKINAAMAEADSKAEAIDADYVVVVETPVENTPSEVNQETEASTEGEV